ncbi:MAG: hypothetical protein J2P20_01750, partial [Pseudonocardia sp.]|nr:hypothetical protein [Pseudonocardia sp.]
WRGSSPRPARPAPFRSASASPTRPRIGTHHLPGRQRHRGRPPHKSPIDNWEGGWQPGTDPARRDYASLADFADPDGNTWVIQEIGYRPPELRR